MLKIKINGKEYPARLVMGALLLFKRESGKDVNELNNDNMEDGMLLIWCCAKCSCQAEGVAFDYDFETFCNSVTPQDVTDWNNSMAEGKKKVTA